MIAVPERDLLSARAVTEVNTDALADWLEANLFFWESRVTTSDVVNSLMEYECFLGDQDDGYAIASQGWQEMRKRKRWGGIEGALEIDAATIESKSCWEDSLIWSFFVLLSIQRVFPAWAKEHADYPTQGELFERVVETICPAMFPGWCSYRTGWSPNEAKDIPAIVEELQSRIFVLGNQNLKSWVGRKTKDGGLDIVCYRRFADEREALPVYFLQCASGRNWRRKIGTPNALQWKTFLDSAVQPSTGIAAPFVVNEDEVRQVGLEGQVVVLDRLRLLSAAVNAGISLPEDLRQGVRDWMRPRVESLREQ